MTEEHLPDDYEVGRGRPPVHSRFKPGCSGNPRGRRKGSRNTKRLLQEALAETVTVTENGRQHKRTKHEIMLMQMVNKAAKGDQRATELIMKRLDLIEQEASQAAAQTPAEDVELGTPEDDQVFAGMLKRLREGQDQ